MLTLRGVCLSLSLDPSFATCVLVCVVRCDPHCTDCTNGIFSSLACYWRALHCAQMLFFFVDAGEPHVVHCYPLVFFIWQQPWPDFRSAVSCTPASGTVLVSKTDRLGARVGGLPVYVKDEYSVELARKLTQSSQALHKCWACRHFLVVVVDLILDDRSATGTCSRSLPLLLSSASAAMVAVVLDRHQQVCFDFYRAGKNVGVFSSAGCGKSVVLKAIVRDAVAEYGSGGVAVCSWHGAAADLIGGHTLHSFFSCGIRLLNPADFVAATNSRSGLLSKLIQVRVLVIDEVFTITGLWLAASLRILLGIAPAGAQTHPAGGVQVIGTCFGIVLDAPRPVCFQVHLHRTDRVMATVLSSPRRR